MLAYNPLYYKTFLTRDIYITSGRRALLTLRSLNIGFTFQKVKSTHLCLPLSMTIAKRFGGNKKGSGLGGKMGNVGKGTPLKPSSLAKPLPPQPKPMSPKHYNHNNVGGMKPFPPYNPLKDSYSAKAYLPSISSSTIPNSSPLSNNNSSSSVGLQQQAFTNTSTTVSDNMSTSNPVNTTLISTTTSDQSLTPTTGAIVVYKPKLKDPVTLLYSNSTIFIDSYGIAFLDHSKTSLPPIPPLPPLPSTPKKQVNTKGDEPITANVLKIARDNLKPPKQLKPSIPQNKKIPNVSDETPQAISEKIAELAKKLSPEEVKNEMLSRGLLTKDNAMLIEVMTETGEIIVIGQGTEHKLSAFGYGHYKQANVPSYMENIVKDKCNIYVAALKNDKVKFQSVAENKHMPILFRKNDQNWYSLGYLTSQPQFKKLGNMQFKAFQDINYRELIPKNPDKPQYLALYDNAKKVPEDQIILLKGGADYLAFIKQTEIINKICEKLMEKAYVNYNPEGLTVEQCIATCIHFDTVVKKNLSHPQTNADILNSAQMAAKKNKIKPVTDETLPE